jgi:hypothetical protein
MSDRVYKFVDNSKSDDAAGLGRLIDSGGCGLAEINHRGWVSGVWVLRCRVLRLS